MLCLLKESISSLNLLIQPIHDQLQERLNFKIGALIMDGIHNQ